MAAGNVVVLGFGYSDPSATLPVTWGFGGPAPSPPLILSGRFQLDSAEYPSDLTLRARFTSPPNFTAGATNTRADQPANFILTGPGATAILVAGRFSGDEEVVDLTLSAPLPGGQYTLSVATTLTGAGESLPISLAGPNEVSFLVERLDQEPQAAGRTTGDAYADLLSFLNPAYRTKPNWRKVVAALAKGDQRQRDMAAATFDQLFVPSASGQYLARRAAERGVSRFVDVGFSDELFRVLATSVYTRKLTQGAFLEMLESVYGDRAVRAYAETGLPEPYVLGDGDTLRLRLDESVDVEVTFRRADFRILRRATADEVAFAVTRALAAAGSAAYARPQPDPDAAAASKVRIFSGSRGLLSAVRVTGGTAQPALDLPTDLFPDPETSVTLPSWTVSQPLPGLTRWECATDERFDLSRVEPGDVLVVTGPEFGDNRGSYTVADVHYAFPGGALEQWLDVEAEEVDAGTYLQDTLRSLRIYRPTVRRVHDEPGYTVVDQVAGDARVSLATTTQSVARRQGLAAYGQTATPTSVLTAVRAADGTLTVTTSAPHGVQVGQQFELSGVRASLAAPASVAGDPPGALSADQAADGTSDTSSVTHFTADTTLAGADGVSLRDMDGDVWLLAEQLLDGAGGVTAGGHAARLHVDSESAGSYAYGYASRPLSLGANPAACVLTWPAGLRNRVLVAGGHRTTPWADMAATGVRDDVEVVRKVEALQPVLVAGQLTSAGVLAGLALTLTSNAQSGDLLSVSDGTTTRTYGFGVGGNVTVTIGASAAATMANLAAAVVGDGSAAWGATYAAGLTGLHASGAVAVYEDAVLATKSGLRVWGNAGLALRASYAPYADASQARPDYLGGALEALPTANPGSGRAGFHRGAGALADGEVHRAVATEDYFGWVEGTTSWSTNVGWFDSQPSTDLAEARAEATATALLDGAAGAALVIGGVDSPNFAKNTIQRLAPTTLAASVVGTLSQARTRHGAVLLPSGRVLVVGGCQPATRDTRTALGFTSWTFDEAFGAGSYAGPVTVPAAGNARPVGKVGYGIRLTSAMVAAPGAPQTALSAALKVNYTLFGWFTSGQGAIVKCGTTAPWSVQTDNTLVEVGVDPADDKFYLRYQTGAGGTVVQFKTTATRTSLVGPTPTYTAPRYHSLAVTLATGSPNTWRMYVDGAEVSSGWTSASLPTSGTTGVWQFRPYGGCVDEWGIAPATLTAAQVLQLHGREAGVSADHPGADAPVGTALASCEEVTDAGVATLVGQMAYARARPMLCALPGGRVLACGGVGWPAASAAPGGTLRAQELRSAEVYDPTTKLWTPISSMADPHSGGLCAYHAASNRVYVAGGYSSTKLEYLDLATMTWSVAAASLPAPRALAGGGIGGDSVLALLGGAATQPSGALLTAAHDLTALAGGGAVGTGRLSGTYRAVAGTTGTTIVAQASGGYASGTGGQVWPSSAGSSALRGPHVFDPKGGFGVGAATATLAVGLGPDRRYPEVTLGTDEALQFGHEPGYVVFRLGYADQVGPVKHLGRSGADTLMVDAGFRFPTAVPAGSSVTLVTQKAPYVPEDGVAADAFFATGSAAGRVAAQQLLEEMSAGGVDLDVEVRYPGDRGLSGEGRPVKGSYKLSDIVSVFGGDHLEAELTELRET